MTSPSRSKLMRYGLAAASCLLAQSLSVVVGPLLETGPFPLFLAAVTWSAWYGGYGPAMLATVLGALAIDYFFETPRYSLAITSLSTVADLALFVLVALLISSLSSRLRSACEQATAARAEAEAAARGTAELYERAKAARAAAETAATDNARLYREAHANLARRSELLRVVRCFAAEGDPEKLLQALLDGAVSLVGGSDAAVFRWNPTQTALEPMLSTTPAEHGREMPTVGEGVTKLAATSRRPVMVDHNQMNGAASVAVPLVHEGQLLGCLNVNAYDADKRFANDEAEVLELLAGIAAAVLVGLDRGDLLSATRSAKALIRQTGDDLTRVAGTLESLCRRQDLPPDVHEAVSAAADGVAAATQQIDQLRQVVRAEMQDRLEGPAVEREAA